MRRDLLETKCVNFVIETVGTYTAGRTVCDILGNTGRAPNADVALGVNRDAFIELLIEGLARY